MHRAGRVAEAAASYRRVLAVAPDHPGALHLLGTIELASGRARAAVGLIERAVGFEPGFAPAHANLGSALAACERHEDAVRAFGAAIRLDGAYGPAVLNLSASLLALGDLAGALDAAERAAGLLANAAAPRCNMAVALDRLGRRGEAERMFEAALARENDHLESLRGLAALRRRARRPRAAIAPLLVRAAALDRSVGDAVALAEFHRAAADVDAAKIALDRAAARHRDDPLHRLAVTVAPLVPVHADEAARARALADYTERLTELDRWARAPVPNRLAALADAFGRVQPFFLAYAVDDVRDLQARFGRLAADAMRARHGPDAAPPPSPVPGERIRLGVVCGFFRDHSVWKIPLRGWLAGLDRDRLDITLYALNDHVDATTEAARAAAHVFHAGPRGIAAWRARIVADRPHVLLYPELGMHGAAFCLAAMRLAPVQLAGPGHPVTSGLPTIDRFLSSAAMEPPDAVRHYTERLVLLPGLGFSWRPPVPSGPASVPALPPGTRFFCGQSPFKYRPDDDALLVAIARAVPDSRFVLAPGGGEGGAGERLVARLGRRFAADGLDWARHGCVLERLTQATFAAVSGACDAVLDAPSWSGCNSTLEGLASGTPVVTLPGATMRSRHTAAILRLLGRGEGIATDRNDYVRLATELSRRFRKAVDLGRLDDPGSAVALEKLIEDSALDPQRA